MDGRNSKIINSPFKSSDSTQEINKNVPRGLMFRELGHKQRLGSVSQEFQAIAEDKLVLKTHEELRCELPGPSRSTFLMVFSPDGTKVASTHGNHNVYVTDLTTGKNVNTLSGHPRTPWCIAFHPSSNQILASGCLGGQVRVWDLHGGSEMWMADGQTVIASLAFHPTDRMLVIATYNELHFWDWSQPEPFTKCYTNNEKEKVRYVAFDPLGHKLITGISNAPQIQTQWDQWDRVPSCNQMSNSSSHSPQHRSTLLAPDRERRITVCYRSLVEQYEQLVQRYFDLSRTRPISTMDRGTDPMDFETEASTSRNNSSNRESNLGSSGTSNSVNNNSGTFTNSESNWRENNNTASGEGTGISSPVRSTNSNSYLQSLFRNPWQRNSQDRPVNRTDSSTATSESEPVAGANSNPPTPSVPCRRHRNNDSSRWYFSPFHHIGSQNRPVSERPCTTHSDTLRRRLSTSALLDSTVSHLTTPPNRDILIVREDNQTRSHANSSNEPHHDRLANRDRPTSPIFLPSRPRRFFVSQSSAFQPRTPRLDHSTETRNSGRSVLPRRATQRISLNAATAAAVAAVPERRTPDSDPPRSRSPLSPVLSTRSRSDMTDVGVRYGIQLLSRHIDNMQRLCRARLEILQLQQIRRMWEDLQHQIRSLHSAVRESSITLARLTESSSSSSPPGPSHLYPGSSQAPNEGMNQRAGSSRDTQESGNDGNSGHIPSVSQMLELARISDNSPAVSGDVSTPNSVQDNLSPIPEEELFQPPAGSSRPEEDSSGVNSAPEPGSSTGNLPNDETNNQQYSFRCQMLQQRLWRISRKVYLRRPRLLTVNSRSMRRQLYSSHSPLNRINSSLLRHGDSNRRPWFLHSVARHRSVAKSTSNVSSQVDPSCPPGKSEGKNESNSSPSTQGNADTSSREVDECQPGPSGLSSKRNASDSKSISPQSCKPWKDQKINEPVLDDDDDEDDDEDESSVHGSKSKINGTKKDNEQQCSLPPAKIRKIDTSESTHAKQSSSQSEAASSTNEEPSAIRKKLLEEIDRLFPTTSSASSSAPSTSSDNAAASTSQGSGPRSNQQEPSTCKSLWSMIARLERLVQQQREQRERLCFLCCSDVLSDQGQSRRTNTWSLRDRNFERVENSGSDSDSNTESERPRNWGRMSAEERLSNALQTEMYERERMCRAAAGAQNSRGGQQEEEWEWTRESTRLRARQVLSLMVESLTQFFEENGLSSNTPHAVLDEQIFNLHVLLQLALELTDLLLAQLVCTRRELEHQWVHRLRSPVALSADDHHPRENDRERDLRPRGRQPDESSGTLRIPPYRRIYRHRLSVDGEGCNRPERSSLRGSRAEYSRRLNPRVMNCLARHNRLSPHSGSAHNSSMRPGRSTYGRPIARPIISRPNVPGHIPSHLMTNPRVSVRRVDADSTSNDVNTGNDGNVERPHAASNESGSTSSPNIPMSQPHDAFTVPLVRVNDVLISDTSLLNQPRTRPQSPPLIHPNSPFANPFSQVGASEQRSRGSGWDYWPYVPGSSWRPRFLHPRYMGPNIFNDDSEEAVPAQDFSYFRANTVPETVIITDAPMTPNHRIQVWDFSTFHIPDISNAEKNVIVPECKIHNDASVDISKDGRLLVTLLPSGRQSITTMLGVYSLQWESLGQCLYTTSFLQSAVSVSLSPASRYLLVGLASRRVALLPNDRHYMAQVFRLDGGKPGRSVGGRGRLCHMRDIEQSRDQGYMSLNCIRWAPGPGQGFVYGTNTGQLRVRR